ncbi:MAG: cobyrinate a,c-diamide synthase [Armatimonadota bacterium]|nr:cobyrinate a,c-diamide synthase [Armatimonadota bacterium]MDR7451146.1 cobyrinate a,c-diamide synthase [Armatimonadota bacterium]MDR7467249.1 cobyrinate a,c-diamide synthase [Armatimonadota bacterium]MDR7494510.1 cobyrinate a,c-diamide synthase [Armatimonadota bacterium]MDR7499913.1 cobyrinate a,c-diamide synthase [Armatimonadota bacterium]
MNLPRIVVAGTHSGCGKTSVALGLIRALRRRGMTVQPYKAGPDFIDPSLLGVAAGRPARNLDCWMLPQATLVELLVRGAEQAQIAVIEGMMGLYDGHGGVGDDGSTAEVARILQAPVILVVDVGGSARSAAATALGFTAFDPRVNIAGVIANRVGGAAHVQMLREAMASSSAPLLGTLPWDDRLRLPERHLGLVPAAEASPEAAIEALADAVAANVDLDAVLRVARTAPPVVVHGPPAFPPISAPGSARIGVARDAAFTFYYQDGLELLEAYGARLVPVSPLKDAGLPEVDGLYLGGGFPEIYARELADNVPMRRAVARAIRQGMPVYAECGGMLYLAETLVDGTRRAEMVGVLPASARMHGRPIALNYVTVEAEADTLLLRTGESVRGHQFHWSTLEPTGPLPLAYRCMGGAGIAGGRDGIAMGAVLATFTHVHFAAKPEMAARFVAACRRFASAGAAR